MRIHEQTTLTEAIADGSATSGQMVIQIVTPGKGSSGYYSAQVCESAAPLVQAGTPMYLDHPTEAEEWQRPERSLRDLAAVFTEGARWDPANQRLVANAQVFAPYREVLTEMAPYIGVSIRGDGNIVEGALPTGGRGRVVESIDQIQSVDFVTKAGRGGKVLALLESARGDVNRRAVARGLSEATVNDTREQLNSQLTDAYGAENTWTSIRDFDDTTVWFYVESSDSDGTYQQTYTQDADGAITLTGERTEVRTVTTYVPVDPAGQTTKESKEDAMPNIEESELARLREADGRVTTLESERDTAVRERDDARRQLAEATARETARGRARTRVTEANGTLAPATVDRIIEAATVTVPLTEAGALDETAFDTAVDTARTSEETYLATLAESTGAGRPAGLGGAPVKEGEVTRKDSAAAIAEAFGRPTKKQED
jgi:hypothetical protein